MSRLNPQIRWLLSEDFPAVARLDFEQAADPWTEDTYREFLQARNQIVQVALIGGNVVGTLACRLESTTLHVERLLIGHGEHRAATLELVVSAIRNKLNRSRSCAEILVHECRIPELIALHQHGFVAVSLVRNHFRGRRDGILMRYSLFRQSPTVYTPSNRLTKFFA